MAKGYSARRGFTNGGAGMSAKQAAMQQRIAQMQADMNKRQQEVEEESFTSSVGGGTVTAVVSGKKQVTSLTIKPEALDPNDVEMLQDMVISAVNEGLRQAEEAMDESMNDLTKAFHLGDLNSLGFSNL